MKHPDFESYSRVLTIEVGLPDRKTDREADEFSDVVDKLHDIWLHGETDMYKAMAIFIDIGGESLYKNSAQA